MTVLLTDNVGGRPKVWADMMISMGEVGRSDENLPWSFRVGYSAAPEFGANEATMVNWGMKATLH